jgi:hypothetical protein
MELCGSPLSFLGIAVEVKGFLNRFNRTDAIASHHNRFFGKKQLVGMQLQGSILESAGLEYKKGISSAPVAQLDRGADFES